MLLHNQWIAEESKEETKKKIPRDKWQQRHNGPKPMGHIKAFSEGSL